MKIKKVEINNFRQFYGKQVVEFSIDPKKPVTLIHGENNGGKTALLNAMRWCLYEEITDNLLDPKSLLNKHAENQKINTFNVIITLEYENRLFEVRRYKIKGNPNSTLNVFEININDGSYSEKPEDNPNTLINTFLPKEMAEYFFYQGEGTGTLNSQNNFSHIKEAIEKVLGLTVAKRTIKHLSSIKSNFQKDLKQYDSTNEVENLLDQRDIVIKSLERDKNLLAKKIIKLDESSFKYESLIAKFALLDKSEIEEKLRNRSENQRYLNDYEHQKRELIATKSKKLTRWVVSAFSKKLAITDIESINTDELNKSLRYSVDKQLLRDILNNHECICGNHVEENSDAKKILDELGKHAVDPDLRDRWKSLTKLKTDLSSYVCPKNEMEKVLSEIDDVEEKIEELHHRINELSHTITESDIKDVNEVEKERDETKKTCDALSYEIHNLEIAIRRYSSDIESIDKKVNSLTSTQPRADKVRNLIFATNTIMSLYQDSIESSKNGVENILLKKMQTLFSQVAFNGYTVKKEGNSKDESFTWAIVDKEGKRVAAGNGYQAMLSISFIVALIEFSKDRSNNKQHLLTPGTTAPFIADSILAFIGPDNAVELLNYIVSRVEQSVFMFSQAQWTENHTDKALRNKIGKEYNLVQHTALMESEFSGKYPTRLTVSGYSFDVVRFGSDFDKVTIEEIFTHG